MSSQFKDVSFTSLSGNSNIGQLLIGSGNSNIGQLFIGIKGKLIYIYSFFILVTVFKNMF